MSQKIEQLLEVINEVKEDYRNNKDSKSIKQLRMHAVSSVAFRQNVDPTTVSDKFIRGLRPQINSTNTFDKLLKDWLKNGSGELKKVLKENTIDYKDDELIEKAFYIVPENEVLLANEFDLEPSDKFFKEGKEQLRIHLTKERNQNLIIRAKEKWSKEENGDIRCSICNFSFLEAYGKRGNGFIEAHHINPISTLSPDTKVAPGELVPVCSNCHRMLHRHRPWLEVEQLRNLAQRGEC